MTESRPGRGVAVEFLALLPTSVLEELRRKAEEEESPWEWRDARDKARASDCAVYCPRAKQLVTASAPVPCLSCQAVDALQKEEDRNAGCWLCFFVHGNLSASAPCCLGHGRRSWTRPSVGWRR